jgi:hypothetical protein
MCQRVSCSTCGKPSFAGCGRHVEQVLADVPPAARCRCREQKARTPRNEDERKPSWLAAFFGGASKREP